MKENKLVIFQDQKIRRKWFNEEWWFVAVDIVEALTNSKDPNGYLKDIRRRDEGFKEGWGQIATPLEITTKGGKQKINCVSTKGAFRLIQSIPSKKAEPFKQWLAKVGYERVQEIENPELAQKRMKELYKLKGYSDEWIEKRVRGISIRDELTDEWKKRNVKTEKEYAILTGEISKATFGMTPSEYKKFKGLKKENLRDHMDDLELIFSMLGERVSTEITKNEDAQGYDEVENAGKRGGRVAGNARKDTEHELGRPITSKENYLIEPEKKKKLKHKKI
ncbi:Bro-N domain-containing protein [archaeon]|jgi:DNA-damage-inducible protein D|nr:Bro-N domain-containing protein [archaeon]MBT4647638.1 Bro-N domain-containing protein [archaeon]MBT6822614.1 Bro-N domain-containing protein [archaeon]MBT7392799.1 Bro-N domain-containing protein [archaeon]